MGALSEDKAQDGHVQDKYHTYLLLNGPKFYFHIYVFVCLKVLDNYIIC